MIYLYHKGGLVKLWVADDDEDYLEVVYAILLPEIENMLKNKWKILA